MAHYVYAQGYEEEGPFLVSDSILDPLAPVLHRYELSEPVLPGCWGWIERTALDRRLAALRHGGVKVRLRPPDEPAWV